MSTELPNQSEILDAIRETAESLGHPPSRSQFLSFSGMTEYQVLKHFPSWREAVRSAGLEPNSTNQPIAPEDLLEDWGNLVRQKRGMLTRNQYRRDGSYSAGVFERKFGPWSAIPNHFRKFAQGKPAWADVIAILPKERTGLYASPPNLSTASKPNPPPTTPNQTYSKLGDRPTYGNPIDFRGLRHEPVNEQGVVFLFGMVARELGYHVEAVQTGFPDCEAKRQINAGKWQRVRIEFEFESRNFRDHGHPPEGCDIIVCWRHNWLECPHNLEVLELEEVVKTLADSED